MDIKRFFASIEDFTQNYVYLRGQEYLHAKKVLRQKVGYLVIVCNGDGYDYHGIIEAITDEYIQIRLTDKKTNNTETKKPIILYQCIAKESDMIVQKAVELGVSEFVPVISKYVNAKFNKSKAEIIATQAAKQCERSRIMKIREPISLEEVLKECNRYDCCLFPYEEAKNGKIRDYVSIDTKSVAVIVGCEGGFAEEEAAMLEKSGYKVVTLGPRILRAETAAIVAVGIILDALGELN